MAKININFDISRIITMGILIIAILLSYFLPTLGILMVMGLEHTWLIPAVLAFNVLFTLLVTVLASVNMNRITLRKYNVR